MWTEQQQCRRMYTFHGLISFLSPRLDLRHHCANFSSDKSAFNQRRLHKVVLLRQIGECNWGNWIHLVLMQCERHHPAPEHRHPGLFSPPYPPPSGTSGHSNTGKLSNVPSVGQRSRFCSHLLKYFLLQTWVDARGRAMESHQTELELINKHLMGESSLLHLGR